MFVSITCEERYNFFLYKKRLNETVFNIKDNVHIMIRIICIPHKFEDREE